MNLDVNNAHVRCEEFQNYRRLQKRKLADIKFQLSEKSALLTTSSVSKGIEMEKSKAPTFSGKTIDYPEFKKG